MLNKLSSYLTATLIVLAGLGFLFGVVYYILFLPVPIPIIPLKHRIITTLQLEERIPIYIFLREDVGQINVYKTHDLDSEKITILPPGGSYKLLEKKEEWYKIKVDEEIKGWVERIKVENN